MYVCMCVIFSAALLVNDQVPSTSLRSSGRSTVCPLSGCTTVSGGATAWLRPATLWAEELPLVVVLVRRKTPVKVNRYFGSFATLPKFYKKCVIHTNHRGPCTDT